MLRVAGEARNAGKGKNRRVSLGRYPLVGVASAREKAAADFELADRGVNPALQRNTGIQERANRS